MFTFSKICLLLVSGKAKKNLARLCEMQSALHCTAAGRWSWKEIGIDASVNPNSHSVPHEKKKTHTPPDLKNLKTQSLSCKPDDGD